MREVRNAYKILFESPKIRDRRILEDNIRMYVKEIGWEFVGWILLAQGRNEWRGLVNTVTNIQVP